MVDYYSCKMSGSDEEFEPQMHQTGMTKAELRRVSFFCAFEKIQPTIFYDATFSFFSMRGVTNNCCKR